MEAKTRKFHEHDSLLAGRESPCRDNTIEGKSVCGQSRFRRLMVATMARPGLEGNRRGGLFPSLLSQGFRGALRHRDGQSSANVVAYEKCGAPFNPRTLGEFRKWVREVYLAKRMPGYLLDKVKQKQIPPAVATAALEAFAPKPKIAPVK
jgi:hypothetical protein